jgi:catalase
VVDGADGEALRATAGRLGTAASASGATIEVDVPMDAAPSVLFDAVILPDGEESVDRLTANGRAISL